MGVHGQAVPGPDQQVLAPRDDLGHQLLAQVDGRELGDAEVAARQHLPGQRLMQAAGGGPDDITFRHESRMPCAATGSRHAAADARPASFAGFAAGQLADDVQLADVPGVLLHEVEQHPLERRGRLARPALARLADLVEVVALDDGAAA